MRKRALSVVGLCAVVGGLWMGVRADVAASQPATMAAGAVVTISGGHETDPRDRGRPVVLVANALGATPEVFREAFSHVKPAGPGEQPQEEQVRKNKQALMEGLSKYGVTDERLNEVSNFYRYRKENGDVWKQKAATVKATVEDGMVTGFVVVDAGRGYSSVPTVSVAGHPEVNATVALQFTKDLQTNGSIKSVTLVK